MKTITLSDEQHTQLVETLEKSIALNLALLNLIDKIEDTRSPEVITEAYNSIEIATKLRDIIDPQ